MWRYDYKDYQTDDTLVEQEVEPGKGIVGVEMHDVNGWNERHLQQRKARGWLRNFLAAILPFKVSDDKG